MYVCICIYIYIYIYTYIVQGPAAVRFRKKCGKAPDPGRR